MGLLTWIFDSGLIGVVGGVYAFLVGAGRVPASRDPEAMDQYLEKYGKILKVLGVVVAVGGLVRLLAFVGVV